mgnify:CR=1 FL=1
MAIIYPNYNKIQKMTVAPTPGEQALLDFLVSNFDDNFEVVFQPSLNGANFDFAILRKGGGIVIIEVKDWHLECYEYISRERWNVKTTQGMYPVLSPFKQVRNYKDELINYYMENSIETIALDDKVYATIETFVFFYNATHSEINEFVRNSDIDEYDKYIGRDDLNKDYFRRKLSVFFMRGISRKFNDDMYNDARMALIPPDITDRLDGVTRYTDKQDKIIGKFSKLNRVRVKGAAGSGKSQVLAKLAVDRLSQTGNRVLIICYNITLINFYLILLRKIDRRMNIKRSDIHIQNYHKFINVQCSNLNIDRSEIDLRFYDQDNSELFKKLLKDPSNIRSKYDTILIDEIQDFKPNWVKNVLSFLADNGKVLYCGDIKQDIYQHQDKEKLKTDDIIYTEGCRGRWNELSESFRLPSEMINFANAFAKRFLSHKNDINLEINKDSQGVLFNYGEIDYHEIEYFDDEYIYNIVNALRGADTFNNETQICILGPRILEMRHLANYFNIKSNGTRKLETTFESMEFFCNLLRKHGFNEYASRIEKKGGESLERRIDNQNTCKELLSTKADSFYRELIKIRRAKKCAFHMDSGSYKLSTIHSFKGWELDNIVLIITEPSENAQIDESCNTDELIYTALTRAKHRLSIININNKKFAAFWRNYKKNNPV